MTNGMIQEGIYYNTGSSPGKCFSIMFLRAEHGINAPQIGNAFQGLWEMYQDLKKGKIREYPRTSCSEWKSNSSHRIWSKCI